MPFGQHYRLFLEGSPDTFFAHDFAGRFVDVNRQACDSLGYTRDELLRMSVTDVDIADNTSCPSVEAPWAASARTTSRSEMIPSIVRPSRASASFPSINSW